MIKLALEDMYDRVQASFADDGINAEHVFGWRTPAQYPGSLPRCAWVPGDDGALGELGAPLLAQDPRPLAQLNELFTVYMSASDPRDIENERAQYHATRFLYEAWFRAAYRAAHGTFRIKSQRWVHKQTDRSFGATLRVVCEIQAPLVDALPDEPLVGSAFAGLADSTDVNVPTGNVVVSFVDTTETVEV